MILFSPAKINIGLQIISHREDGFHNLRSVMFPIGLCDILEIHRLPDTEEKIQFSHSGIGVDSLPEKNLCVQAWDFINREVPLPPVEIHLHKKIPVGAGLGGGSSNATHTLIGLNQLAGGPLSNEKLHEMAAQLGSDCPYFLHHGPMMMEGRGEILSQVSLNLHGFFLVLLFPGIHISTAEAYAGVTPSPRDKHLRDIIAEPAVQWKKQVVNDFEQSLFVTYPELDLLKQKLYEAGAIYASMSGSGSSLYGIFSAPPVLPDVLTKHVVWEGPAISPH